MVFTVALEIEHLPIASAFTQPVSQPRVVLVPNLDPRASVKSSLKKFVRDHLYIPEEQQCLTAPLFSALADQVGVEDIHSRYSCHADAEGSDLHVDEETFAFFGRERGQFVELQDHDRLDERHVIDELKLHLKKLPKSLPDGGGRIFVETQKGILPLLGVSPRTPVSEIKKRLEIATGVPVSQQLLSSVGRVMHDEFLVEDFDGPHMIYEDSTLDLCKSGDTNAEQAHRRMTVQVNICGEHDFTLVVQGRDTVRSLMEMVESRTGFARWQQRISFSGKTLDEKKTLSDYFIYPQCVLQVNVFKNSSKFALRASAAHQEQEQSEQIAEKPLARKLKLVRTCRGTVMGTLTIPVLTSDTVFDLRRKIKRSLQPLVERNLSMNTPMKEPRHIDITPRCSPATGGAAAAAARASSARSAISPASASRGGMAASCSAALPSASTSSSSPRALQQRQSSALHHHHHHARQAPAASSSSSPSPLQDDASSAHHNNDTDSKSVSARRLLQFGPPPMSTASVSPLQRSFSQRSSSSAPQTEKKSLGVWINGSVVALKEQIRAQLSERL